MPANAQTAIQEFFTSRNNGIVSADYVGQQGRLWYDPVTNSIRVYDGTAGGRRVTAGGGGNASLTVGQSNISGGNLSNVVSDVSTIYFDTDAGLTVNDLGDDSVVISFGSTFKYWEVTGQPTLEAQGEDTVEFIAGNNIAITTSNTSTPQSIAFAVTGTVPAANTVTNSAQPNITSVGTLTALTVSGNTALGDLANVSILGGNAGYVITTNGAGVLTWQPRNNIGVSYLGNQITPDVSSLNFTGGGVLATAVGNSVTISVPATYAIFDGGGPEQDYSGGPAFDCGGVL